MRVPLGWLRDYIDLEADGDEIARRLGMLGFPVEGIERRPRLGGVVVGRITELGRHPNADRLQVCTVDVGAADPLTIVTAATNVAEGQTVGVATIGSDLVDGAGRPLRIERRAMRGIESHGMLCSAHELALTPEWFEDGILQLDAGMPLGSDVVHELRLLDDVLDVEVTPNRADAMSIVGIARELGAALRTPVREPVEPVVVATLSADDAAHDGVRVTLESPDCRRFVAQRFADVRVGVAPAWMRVRLALAGQRPINNLVDVSNFVMLELGQPQHFYDLDRLAGRRLIVRDARDGEPIRTLDGEERRLDARELVIADEREPQCIAGLMGAAASEVGDATREIVVESANFSGPRVRRAGAALALRSEASARHERGLPLQFPDVGAARAEQLLRDMGATPGEAFAVGRPPSPHAEIALPTAGVGALLGIALRANEIAGALRSLGFEVRAAEGAAADAQTLLVRPPYWRSDVVIAADVAEEVARAIGYDRIAAAQAPVYEQSISSAEYRHEDAIARAFVAGGYREALTLPLQPLSVYERFVHAGVAPLAPPIAIRNPLSEDQGFLRFSLLPGLLELVAAHQSKAPLRLFEIGHVFERGASDREEFETAVAAWVYAAPKADEPDWRDSGFLCFKGESAAVVRAITGRDADTVTARAWALHPGKTASLLVDGRDIAWVGAVDPRLCAAYEIGACVYAGLMRSADVPGYRVPRYRPASRFPSVERDLALVVAPDVPAVEIESAIGAAADGIVRRAVVFDEYRGPQVGEGRKSLAVRVTFQRDDGTLTDEEVDTRVAEILRALREQLGAEIRA